MARGSQGPTTRRVCAGGTTVRRAGEKKHERTKIDTGADLWFVCDDCIGNAVKTAHDMEKKQGVFIN